MSSDKYQPFQFFLNQGNIFDSDSVVDLIELYKITKNARFQKNRRYIKYPRNRNVTLNQNEIIWNTAFKKYVFDLNTIASETPIIKEDFGLSVVAYGKKQISKIEHIWKNSPRFLQFILNLLKSNQYILFYRNYHVLIDKDKKTLLLSSKIAIKYQLIGHQQRIISVDIHQHILISADKSGIVKLWNLKELGHHKKITPFLNLYFDQKEWLIWNEQHQYISSKKGAHFFGFLVHLKKSKTIPFYTLDSLRASLYNKEKIVQLLNTVFLK